MRIRRRPGSELRHPTYRDLNEVASTAMVQAKEQADGTPLWKTSVAALGASVEFVTGLPTCLLRSAGGGKRSFSGDTKVLLDDGTEKALKDIKVGDVVLATDPETGEEGPREVTDVWVHDDDLYTLTINGKPLTTTEDHPYWDVTDGQWERADELDKGDLLRTPDGTAQVDSFTYATHQYAAAYNLTVDGIHTYYVLAGDTPVLVHNCGGGTNSQGEACTCTVRNNNTAGYSFEKELGLDKEKKVRIPSVTGAPYRTPDLTRETFILDAKNVKRLKVTPQIIDFAEYAASNNLQFAIVTNQKAVISPAMRGMMESGLVSVYRVG